MRPSDGRLIEMTKGERRSLRRQRVESARSMRHRLKRERRRRLHERGTH